MEHAKEKTNIAATVAEIVSNHIAPSLIKVQGQDSQTPTEILILPRDLTAQSIKPFLEPFLPCPERRKGTATMTDLQSLIDHTNRFRDADSALFANTDTENPSLTAIINYHQAVNSAGDNTNPAATAGWGDHRAVYKFPVSPEWTVWTDKQNTTLNQADFAMFMEDRALDILPAPVLTGEKLSDSDTRLKNMADLLGGTFASPQKMMDLSRGLRIHEQSEAAHILNLSSGEGEIVFKTEHSDEAGEKVKIPNLFLIGIPVFKNGTSYRIACRLRYRKTGAAINWTYDLYRADLAFDDALREACDTAVKETHLPLFYGNPE